MKTKTFKFEEEEFEINYFFYSYMDRTVFFVSMNEEISDLCDYVCGEVEFEELIFFIERAILQNRVIQAAEALK